MRMILKFIAFLVLLIPYLLLFAVSLICTTIDWACDCLCKIIELFVDTVGGGKKDDRM